MGVEEKIESCSQQDVELHVKQVWVVSASDPQLPLQIEDAGRRVTDDEEGNFAKVNQDTRLDNRVLDLRTPTNQAIFRLEAGVCALFRDTLTKAGIGMERVCMLYLGLDNIRKTSMFPRDPKRL